MAWTVGPKELLLRTRLGILLFTNLIILALLCTVSGNLNVAQKAVLACVNTGTDILN